MTTPMRVVLALIVVSCDITLPAAVTLSEPQGTQSERNPAILAIEKAIAGKEQAPAEQVFKNIQTFKGMPAIRVLRIMEQAFVPNLGVQCTHCHVEGAWDSDEKRAKGIARGMWTLRADVQDQVRKLTGNAKSAVTCYTCHKGAIIPAFTPGN